ncbi:MAG: hypothetical protein ACR2H3_02955 [Acidimicrobiales bacterium]
MSAAADEPRAPLIAADLEDNDRTTIDEEDEIVGEQIVSADLSGVVAGHVRVSGSTFPGLC